MYFLQKKRVQYMVYFLFGSSPGAAVRKSIEEFFCSLYSRCTRFCIAAGDTVTGISKAYQSYTSAVISLQSQLLFPHRYLSVSFLSGTCFWNSSSASASPENEFLTLLTEKNKEKAKAFLDNLFLYYNQNQNVLPNQAKDLYYKLFRALDNAARQLKLTLSDTQENLIDTLEKIFSYNEMHQEDW